MRKRSHSYPAEGDPTAYISVECGQYLFFTDGCSNLKMLSKQNAIKLAVAILNEFTDDYFISLEDTNSFYKGRQCVKVKIEKAR
jgi:hypothetical protein